MGIKHTCIGLVGYAGSGKDTTASLLQIELLERAEQFSLYAFAEPLKNFIINVFGIPKENLYDQELKEKPITIKSSEFNLMIKFTGEMLKIIDIYADRNNSNLHNTFIRFNEDYDDDFLSRTFSDFMRILEVERKHRNFIARIVFGPGDVVYETTPRKLAQLIGTEFFRDCVSKSFWSDIAPKESIIYTDVRFKEEADVVKSNGGCIVKIINQNQKMIKTGDHKSEQFVDSVVPDYVIINNGKDFDSLITNVTEFVKIISVDGKEIING